MQGTGAECTDLPGGLGVAAHVLWLPPTGPRVARNSRGDVAVSTESSSVPRGPIGTSRQEEMSMSGGGFAGFPGQSGSSASEMPPLVRRPDPAPSPEDSHPVSDPLPFQRPETARPSATQAQGDVLTEVEAAELGPTGRPMPSFPEPPPVTEHGAGPGDLDVQPEGRGRQDHDHHQPRCRARRVRPQGAARRLRPAGLAVGRPRPQPARDGPDDLQPADAARRDPRRRRGARPACPAWTCCRRTSTCRPPRCSSSTRWPASRPCSGCSRRRSTSTT